MNKQSFFDLPKNRIQEPMECAAYCREYWKDDTEHILRIAGEIVERTFLFDLKWDMERTFQPVHFQEDINWNYMPEGDPEFIYQLNRHRYFTCLGQAYLLTGEEIYAETFVSLLLSWIKGNPLNEDTKRTTWRTIEVGLRGENWTKAIRFFQNSPTLTESVMTTFIDELKQHGDYLYNFESQHSKKSNWGVLENSGLLAIGCALRGEKESEPYIRKAMERLEDEISLQVYGDGIHWEQSPMYHNEVFHCCVESIRLTKGSALEFSKDFQRTIEKMGESNAIGQKPNGAQITQGDSDETDTRDLLTCGAYLFGNPKMKKYGYERMDFEGIWDYGISSNTVLEVIPLPLSSENTEVHDLFESGNYYIATHSEVGKKEDFFHFSHGDLGGGHGHFDRLHIDLSLGGEDVLVDSGRYTYVESKERCMLKHAYSHNVPMVDGKEYMECVGSWGTRGSTALIPAYVKHEGGMHLFKGSHMGYLRQGVFVTRTILILSPLVYLILDEFHSEGRHDYEQMFHFNPDGKVTLSGNRAVYQGEKIKSVVHFLTETEKVELFSTKLSRHYNQLEDNQSIKATVHKEGNASLLTIITKEEQATPLQVEKIPITNLFSPKALTDEIAEAVKITNGQEETTIIIGHTERGGSYELLGNMDQYGMGNILIFTKTQTGTHRTIMR